MTIVSPRLVRVINHARPALFLSASGCLLAILLSCEMSPDFQETSPPLCSEALDSSNVASIIAEAISQAAALSENVTVAVVNREGYVLGMFAMAGSPGDSAAAVSKARTAAYLSSNQNAFTTLTACFITRPHFPPGIANTTGGPLYGVPFSSLPGGDIQPNPGPLAGSPGGVPLYKGSCLVGGVGVSGGSASFDLNTCSGASSDELIALGASIDFLPPAGITGENILIDGIRFLYDNTAGPSRATAAPLVGTFLVPISPPFPDPSFPNEGVVMLGGGFDFPIVAGVLLTASEVQKMIDQASVQAARTRAAIRLPIGTAAQVFISVVDIDGSVLGVWRTPDATLFSFDVAVQKARTALAFSDPANTDFGQTLRRILGRPVSSPLAVTTRAVGFLAQDFFPPGIDMSSLGFEVAPGPLWEGPEFAYQDRLSMLAGLPPYGNGITIFPGGIPLYKNGELAGAIGVSGDGVDQDDLIAFAGATGFTPPAEFRSDQFFYDGVRLPFVKFPRSPEVP